MASYGLHFQNRPLEAGGTAVPFIGSEDSIFWSAPPVKKLFPVPCSQIVSTVKKTMDECISIKLSASL